MKIRKTIPIDVNETFDADVTLGLEEMVSFFEECNDREKSQIKAALRISINEFGGEGSVIDQLKRELVFDALKRFTLDELEARLK